MLRTRQATLIAVIVGAASPYLAVDRSSAAGPRSADPIVYTIWRSTLPSAFDVSRRLQDVQGPAAPRDRQGQKSHQMKQVFVTSPQKSVSDDSWLRDKLPITKGSLSRSHEPSVTALPLNARRSQAKLRCCPDPVIGAHAQKGYRHSCHRRCHQRCRPHVDCLAAAERAASDSVGRVRRLQRSPDYD